jgi:protein-S-isoprenylcysteine O-methyltransferase Ste14
MSEAQSKQGGAKVRLPPPLVFVVLIAVGVGLQHLVWRLGVPLARVPRFTVGGALGLAGFFIGLFALGWFKRTGQDPAPWKPAPELIVQGIYRYTRNPMYVGMTLMTLGIGAALGNVWILGGALVGLIVVHYTAVLPEERYLGEKFGDSYAQYKKSVRRYL